MGHEVTKCPPVGFIVKFCRICHVLSQTCTEEVMLVRNGASKSRLSRIQAGCVCSDSEPQARVPGFSQQHQIFPCQGDHLSISFSFQYSFQTRHPNGLLTDSTGDQHSG